jgi:pimeloyl-ACP methyl ester carboxylesterase
MAHVLNRFFVVFAILSAGCGLRPGQSFSSLAYPAPVSRLQIEGISVAFTDVGQGEPALLLIHGLGSYLPVWQRNLDALSREHRVVAIDLPGYGKSSKANYEYSMAFYARVVDRVIEALHLSRVVLVGHSMGGQIAMTHALLRPGRAEALVLAAPAGFERFGPGEGAWLAEAVDKDYVARSAPEAIYANVAVNFSRMPAEARFMVDDRLRVIGGPDFLAYAYAVARSVYAMIHEPVADRLPSIQVPVLVVFGEEDRMIPNPILHGGSTRAVAESGVRQLPRARLVLIPHAGHMLQFERPDVFNRAVLEFLTQSLR